MRITDDASAVFSTVLDSVESQISDSDFEYHVISALNLWHFNRSEKRTKLQQVTKPSHSALVFRSDR